MSVGQTIRLTNDVNRARASRWCQTAPHGAVVNVREANRSTEQNAKMWAMLSDISRAKPEGRELTPDVWKSLFLHSLDHAQRFEMALDGKGMVPVGFRSSRLNKEQMSDLIETIYEYGARHDVSWSEPASVGRSPEGQDPEEGLDAKHESAVTAKRADAQKDAA